jgi:hypothetical protein
MMPAPLTDVTICKVSHEKCPVEIKREKKAIFSREGVLLVDMPRATANLAAQFRAS